MIIIQEKNQIADSVLGHQKYDSSVSFRPMKYCIYITVPEGELIYNVLTQELILTNDNPDDRQYLIRNWFWVPCDFDEKRLIHDVRRVARLLSSQNALLTDFTILPTTECNARCSYCYEKGKPQARMTDDTAFAIIDFIKRYRSKNININWFGGEPLFNSRVIDIIAEGLSDTNYSSSMITNGYLFDEGLIDNAVSLWHLKRVQITLDGTEEEYNKKKLYIYNSANSPFIKVMSNIKLLLCRGIDVEIRLNMDCTNYPDLMLLVDRLSQEFGNFENIWIYTSIIYQCIDDENLYIMKEHLDEKLQRLGLQNPRKLNNSYIRFHQCQADYDNSILINPNGGLNRCEHSYDEDPCGDVWKGITNKRLYQSWNDYLPDFPDCDDCSIRPCCIRLSKCELNKAFTDSCPVMKRNKRIDTFKKRMIQEYKSMIQGC